MIFENKSTIFEHLAELRNRLIKIVLVLLVMCGICFYFADHILGWLVVPLQSALGNNLKLTYWNPGEAFFVYMNIAFMSALIISFPLIAIQIWAFIAPALYAHEKRAFFPFLLATPIMFSAGVALAYYFVLPAALTFFADFQSEIGDNGAKLVQETRVGDYVNFVLNFFLAFGASFQLPIFLVLLGRIGVISSQDLKKFRNYALFILAVVSALITPPDIFSMLGLLIPLYGLYEISILLTAMFEKKRTKLLEARNFKT